MTITISSRNIVSLTHGGRCKIYKQNKNLNKSLVNKIQQGIKMHNEHLPSWVYLRNTRLLWIVI